METIKRLIIKRLRQPLSAAEEQLLQEWMAESAENREIVEEVNDPERLAESFAKLDNLHTEEVWERVKPFTKESREQSGFGAVQKKSGLVLRTAWVRYAAAIILVFGTGIYMWVERERKITVPVVKAHVPQDVPAPSSSHATVTLANGHRILIDDAAFGAVATEGDVCIDKISDGHIVYTGSGGDGIVRYNTLSVPRGSQITSVVLSDGSKVFLNAASSLTYPVSFSGNERRVSVTGEAYFEVAKNPSRKFIVDGGGMTTEVLGTHFNVNTYPDETAKNVTLLEGSVKVSSGPSKLVVQPGQQAVLMKGVVELNPAVDIDQVMVWMNGLFDFQDKRLPEVMRQLARWYDLQVIYEKNIPEIEFFGQIDRNLKLSDVLRVLESTGVRFRIEAGRRVIVMSK